jgi:predicted Zn-dependent protease
MDKLTQISVSNSTHESNDKPQSNVINIVIEIAKEAWDFYVQYKRTIDEVTNYWEDEIKTGLSNGKYTNNIDDIQYSRIKNTFDRLAKSLTPDINKHNWRIYLHNSDEVNAFAALDGIIIINRGIVEFCQTYDELALVIGHEMAHITEGHVKKQVLAKKTAKLVIEHISSFIAKKKNKRLDTEEISDKEISDKELFQLIFGLAGELALLKFSRLQEEKADKAGAMYAANVGYDTVKGYDFWKRMASITNDSKWTAFLSAHPYSQERAAAFLNSVTPA